MDNHEVVIINLYLCPGLRYKITSTIVIELLDPTDEVNSWKQTPLASLRPFNLKQA